MKTELISLDKIIPHEANPRFIRDEKFQKLINSIKSFPEMMEARPIIVNKDMIVLGGNMRLRACLEAGLKKTYITKVDWSKKKQDEFIIKDNVGFGQWDWDILANEWESEQLNEWGLDTFESTDLDLDDFFEDPENHEKDNSATKITLNYTEEDYALVEKKFNEMEGSKEAIVFKLLGLKR